MTEPTAPVENIELSEQDLADLETLGSTEANPPRTLLEVWTHVLSNIENSEQERVTPEYANRVVGHWPKLDYQDVPAYNKAYHALMRDLRAILHEEIDADPEALQNTEDDARENREHYLNLLLNWQIEVMSWEHEWDVTAHDAHIHLAAISDAASFFLGSQGLVDHLSQIRFDFDEATQADLMAKLEAAKAELGE